MEQSKLISVSIAKLKVAYPYYFRELTDEEFAGLISMYQEELSHYSELVLTNAIKSIIKKSKFMPTLKELIDECESIKKYNVSLIVSKMIQDGYFKSPMEIEKTYKFIEEGNIPDWLKEDMKKYGYEENKKLICNKVKMINYEDSRF